MKILLSPAKSLNFDKEIPNCNYTTPDFLEKTAIIHKSVKKLKPKEIGTLMSISDNLANLNWQRFQDFEMPFTIKNARPAIFTFDGDVYIGLDIFSLPTEKFAAMQNKIRILSGFYGLLKPLDLMQAYRLEMGTKITINKSANLYEFWKKTITDTLNNELKNNELLVNLASKEYSSAVDFKKMKNPIIQIDFKDYKDGKLKIISFFAKKARGLMARYILDTNAETIDDLKKFNYENYAFDANLSKENHLVFTR